MPLRVRVRSVEDRVVAVLGAHTQGSGVLLHPRLVLTSAHIVDDPDRMRAAVPGRAEPMPGDIIWAGDPERCDAALLHLWGDLTEDGMGTPSLRWGVLGGRQPQSGCQVLGFPAVQRYTAGGTEQLEAVQIPGTVTPMSGRLRGRYVLHGDHHPPEPPADGGSPWAGLSGGPLLVGQVLVGIAAVGASGWQHSAVEAVPLGRILGADGFEEALSHWWVPTVRPRVEQLHDGHPEDYDYEERYVKAIKARYSRMEVFGLDDLGTGESDWDLDTAYLSLEAQAGRRSPGPRRVEELLRSRPRTVLRGEAGAGKTTLVWWLASHAALDTLPDELEELNGLVPFVIPMRTLAAQGITRPTPDRLPLAAQLPVDEPPRGWAVRALEAGHVLLLVDGLDEVPQADRAAARKWLTELLRMYPRTRCMVTTRPLAVEDDWLAGEGFEELRLLPMRDADIQSFVAAWHQAARLECGRFADAERADLEIARLRSLEQELGQEFRRNAVLRNLARTPLLCAVICALHRRRSGMLPETRWELYRASLAMLLGRRDDHREVGSPEGVRLTVEDGLQLLQRIAVWLVRNGRSQLSHAEALRQLKGAMSGLRNVRKQNTTAETVLVHLLNRSGLLQERGPDSLQFVHRTFQDYLAAKEFQETGSLDELLKHALEEEWQDVIRLVIGHCGRHEADYVIDKLIEVGNRLPEACRPWKIRVLAVECALGATYVAPDRYEAVWKRLEELMPPCGLWEAESLAPLGAEVIGVLPSSPDGLTPEEARNVIEVLSCLGSAGFPLLKRFASA
ncbi:NACHT domain-containing protein [Streptomyces sp. NPDC049577]|uniref:NACHT domain-containing protein n=1 Tax=Streptomyces sp. NPDC049577 TaxID=3155153 RepID=UPI003430C129